MSFASVVNADDSGMPSDATIVSKRKQWTIEQKLEFALLFKKYGNKNKAAKEVQPCYKGELNSRTYNHRILSESIL